MALFKRPNGRYLTRIYIFGEGGVEETPWTIFLDYRATIWTDVSPTMVANLNK
jgi:hypothetical protein